jgi:hypothetical protein
MSFTLIADEVDANSVMLAGHEGDLQLGPYAVRRAHKDRVSVRPGDLRKGGKAAYHVEHTVLWLTEYALSGRL